MTAYLTHFLIQHLILFQTLLLGVVVSNTWLLHRARRHTPPSVFPKVSILVPARNEERNISDCTRSLLAQDYPCFEVIVLDDQSSDGTRVILDQIACADPSLRILAGSPPPEGFSGKNWACVQLAQAAAGELLFFTDADTRHAPPLLRVMVTALLGENADLLTGFPRQQVHTWGERLLVPFFGWALLCFNPLGLLYSLRLPGLAYAVGQALLFRRAAYLAAGGHTRLGATIVEDMALAQHVKASGLRWRVAYIADAITCRMYRSSGDALQGFTKNLFAAFNFRLVPFVFVLIWLGILFWEPLVVLAAWSSGFAPQARLGELLSCVGLSLLVWLIPYLALGLPGWQALLYPLGLLAVEWAALRSLYFSLAGRLTWKGRTLRRQGWKWF